MTESPPRLDLETCLFGLLLWSCDPNVLRWWSLCLKWVLSNFAMEYSDSKLDPISSDKILLNEIWYKLYLSNAVSPTFSHGHEECSSTIKCVLVSTTDRKRKHKATTSLGHKVTKLLVDFTRSNSLISQCYKNGFDISFHPSLHFHWMLIKYKLEKY